MSKKSKLIQDTLRFYDLQNNADWLQQSKSLRMKVFGASFLNEIELTLG